MRDTMHDILWFIVPFGVFDTHNSHELLYTDLIINNVKCSIEFNWCIILNFRCESKRLGTTCHCRRNSWLSVLPSHLSSFDSMLKHTITMHHHLYVYSMWIIARALRKSMKYFVSISFLCAAYRQFKITDLKEIAFLWRYTVVPTLDTHTRTHRNHSKTRRNTIFVRGVYLSYRRNCQ